MLVRPKKSFVKLDNVNRFGIVVACCKSEQYNNPFFVVDTADGCCVIVLGFDFVNVGYVYKQSFAYFGVCAGEVGRFEYLYRGCRFSLLVGPAREGGTKTEV